MISYAVDTTNTCYIQKSFAKIQSPSFQTHSASLSPIERALFAALSHWGRKDRPSTCSSIDRSCFPLRTKRYPPPETNPNCKSHPTSGRPMCSVMQSYALGISVQLKSIKEKRTVGNQGEYLLL